MGRGAFVVAVLVLGFTGVAADISGSWSTSLALGEGVATQNALTLNLGFADWRLMATWTFSGLSMSGADLSLEGSFGALGVAAGISFRPTDLSVSPHSNADFTGLSLAGWEFTGGFISVEVSLGNLTLKVTLVEESPRYPEK